MNFKVHSPRRARYQQHALARFMLSGLGAIFLSAGALNIYFAASPGGLPFWAIGLITALGWHATFARFWVGIDLDKGHIVLKASSLYPIFCREYGLSQVLGFRVICQSGRSQPYQVVMVCKNGEQATVCSFRHRGDAKHVAQQFSDFARLPLTVDMI